MQMIEKSVGIRCTLACIPTLNTNTQTHSHIENTRTQLKYTAAEKEEETDLAGSLLLVEGYVYM